MEQSTEQTITAPEETSSPFTMVVTLKSGVQIRMRVTEYTVGRNGFGALVRLKWTGAEDTDTNLKYLDTDEVAAIHSEGLSA